MNYSEREKEVEGNRAFGAPSPVLAWFLCIPCRNWSAILFTPHSFLLSFKNMHAHACLYVMPAISNSVIQQNIVWYSKKTHCVVWMPQAFSISTHIQRWKVSAAVYSGGWQPAKLAAFRLLMHWRTQSHTWVTLVWPWGATQPHVIFYTLVWYLQSGHAFIKPIRLL